MDAPFPIPPASFPPASFPPASFPPASFAPARIDTDIPFIADDLADRAMFEDLGTDPPVESPESMVRGFREEREEGLIVESAVGRFVTIAASLLQVLADRRRAVGLVRAGGVDYRGQAGQWMGTGFLVGESLLLTNHHVLNTVEVAAEARVEFDFEVDAASLAAGKTTIAPSKKVFRLAPGELFVTSPVDGGLDYSFVRITPLAASEFGSIPMKRSSFTVDKHEQAFVIHHPAGRAKEASVDDTDVLGMNSSVIHYASDTEGGSSGAPVFDRQGRLIALHHASRRKTTTLPDGQQTPVVNEGIKLAAIALDLERRAQQTGADAAMAREVLQVMRGSDSLTGFFGGLGRDAVGDTVVEKVVNTYRGKEADIDVGFWNIEILSSLYGDPSKLDGAAAVIADLMLDAWGLSEVSPNAVAALVKRLKDRFELEYDYALSEPNAPDSKQSTAVIWRTATLRGKRVQWPEKIARRFRLRSDDPDAPDVESVEGRIFDRFPALFELTTLASTAGSTVSLHVIPLHLKAYAEGSKRRRQASELLGEALAELQAQGVADVIVGGDVNAELASGDLNALTTGGFVAMGAADEADGAFTYVKGPRSLIDNIFLSPNLARKFGDDNFMIVAKDRTIGNYVRTISDHRPVMMRLSLAELQTRPTAENDGGWGLRTRRSSGTGPALPKLRDTERHPASANRTITYRELLRRMHDPDVPDRELAPYLAVSDASPGPFQVEVKPNPARVFMEPRTEIEVESALGWANGIARFRRRLRFERRLAAGENKPVLVSEGDSWFQFPFLIEDVIDHLNRDFLVCSLDEAGDTAENMINRNPEYMQTLLEQKANVAGFLLSAAGNDVIGADANGGSALSRLLLPFKPGRDAAAHLDQAAVRKMLTFLEGAYRMVVSTVRSEPQFRRLPIFIHGYDYAIPGGFAGDPRDPLWATQDRWLGRPMVEKGIADPMLQRQIVRLLIDQLYSMLAGIAGNSSQTRVFLVDARNMLGSVGDWADEIHATSSGFARVAQRFRTTIVQAIAAG